LLDIYGSLVNVSSSKNYNLESIIKEMSSYGKVVVVGTDVNPCHKFVRKISKALKAELFIPKENMLVKKKVYLNNEFRKETKIKMKNKHQRDALAIAMIALKSLNPLLNKIELHLIQENKEHLTEKVKEIVLVERIPINKAVKSLSN